MKKLIDLHLHLDGSVPVSTIKDLMRRQGMPQLPDRELREKLSVDHNCRDLDEFLRKFAFPVSLMQSKGNLRQIAFDLLKELKKQGLVYVEIRFAPQLHTEQGLTQREVMQAVLSGLDQFFAWQKKQTTGTPLHANLLLCLMRLKDNLQENEETLRVAEEFYGQGVTGIDLAGAECPAFAIKKYRAFFHEARINHIPYTIHAGEAMGPASVKQALALGAKRIGHGIRSIEDPALVRQLIKEKITLECCATSNLNTKAFTQIDHYPVKKLLGQGVKVTLNSDDMTVCNINLPHEYRMLEAKTGLNGQDERQLFINAAQAAFCSPQERERLLALA